MLEGVSVVRSEKVKDELVVDGNDIELVSRSCALINQVCSSLLCALLIHSVLQGLCNISMLILTFLCFNRNAMSKTKISGNSSTVSMSARRGPLSRKTDQRRLVLCLSVLRIDFFPYAVIWSSFYG